MMPRHESTDDELRRVVAPDSRDVHEPPSEPRRATARGARRGGRIRSASVPDAGVSERMSFLQTESYRTLSKRARALLRDSPVRSWIDADDLLNESLFRCCERYPDVRTAVDDGLELAAAPFNLVLTAMRNRHIDVIREKKCRDFALDDMAQTTDDVEFAGDAGDDRAPSEVDSAQLERWRFHVTWTQMALELTRDHLKFRPTRKDSVDYGAFALLKSWFTALAGRWAVELTRTGPDRDHVRRETDAQLPWNDADRQRPLTNDMPCTIGDHRETVSSRFDRDGFKWTREALAQLLNSDLAAAGAPSSLNRELLYQWQSRAKKELCDWERQNAHLWPPAAPPFRDVVTWFLSKDEPEKGRRTE